MNLWLSRVNISWLEIPFFTFNIALIHALLSLLHYLQDDLDARRPLPSIHDPMPPPKVTSTATNFVRSSVSANIPFF